MPNNVEEKSTHCVCFGQSEANRNEEAVNNSPCDADGRLSKLVVTIPTSMPLTDAEKSVLSKGLSFVPVSKTTDEYQAKTDCESLHDLSSTVFDLSSPVQNTCFIYLHSFIHPSRLY